MDWQCSKLQTFQFWGFGMIGGELIVIDGGGCLRAGLVSWILLYGVDIMHAVA